jgi:hypothetical protein
VYGPLTLFVFAAVVYFGPQTVEYWRIRPVLLRPPDESPRGWSSVPHPLVDTSLSQAEGTVLSYYGYSFDVPWTQRDKERDEGSMVEVSFKNGPTVRFVRPGAFQANPVNPQDGWTSSAYLKHIFGADLNESRYQQFENVVSAIPSKLSPLQSRGAFARTKMLLEIKGTWFEHNVAAPDIFSFEAHDCRGFEISGLSKGWQSVALDLFDSSDHWLRLNVKAAHSNVKIEQSQINRIIQSFKPVALDSH